jgi:hypothetical protein
MEPPKGPINIQGQLAPLSWMISSKSLIVGVICSKCVIPNCSHPSWHGKVCFNIWKGYLWMTIMNLDVPIRFKLRSGGYIGLPIMFLSLRELLPQAVQRQFLVVVRLIVVKMEPLEVVELLGVVVQGHPIVHEVHCLYLT